MKYTLEELEEQVEGALRTVRNLAAKLEAERLKTRELVTSLRSTCQAYHLLASTLEDRHQSSSWLNCNEQTCLLAKQQLDLIEPSVN